MSDLTQHVSNNSSYDNVLSQNQGSSISKVASDTLRKAEQFGKQVGITTAQSSSILAEASLGVSIGGLGCATKIQGASEERQHDIMDKARSFVQDNGLSENFQDIMSFAQDKRSAEHDDTGKRLSDSVSTLYDHGQSHQEQADRYHQMSSSYSSLADYAENNSVSVNQRYNQEFVDCMVKQIGSLQKFLHVMHNRPEEFKTLQSNFVHQKESSMLGSINAYDLTTESGYKKAQDTLSQSYTPISHNMAQPHKPWVKGSSYMSEAKKEISDNLAFAQDTIAEKMDDMKQLHREKSDYVQDIENMQSESKVVRAIKNVGK